MPQNWETIRNGNKFISSVSHFWLTRRFVYEELEGYRDVPYAEDYDFLLRGEIKEYKYANVADPIYKMRLRNGNTVSSNGLLQKKSFYYVKKLHRKELKTKKNMFSAADYERAVSCTERQKKRFSKAAMYLNKAVVNKKNFFYMTVNVIKAVLCSRYIFYYLISAVRFRILLLHERVS